MKKIEAIIAPFKLEEVKQMLRKEKIPRVTIVEVKGAGSQQSKLKQYRGVEYLDDTAQVKIEFMTDDGAADQIAQALVTTLATGSLCNGEVAILPVEKLTRVRIGECSYGRPSIDTCDGH